MSNSIKNMIAQKRKQENLDINEDVDYSSMDTENPEFHLTDKKLKVLARAVKPALAMEKLNETKEKSKRISETSSNGSGNISLSDYKEMAKMIITEDKELMRSAYEEVFSEIMQPAIQAMIKNEAKNIVESLIGDFADDIGTITEDINKKYASIGGAYNKMKKRGLL